MNNLREQVENILYHEVSVIDSDVPSAAFDIIALVRADYEQKVIEAVKGVSEGKSWDEWNDGYEFALKEAEKAIKQVMADGE